MRLKCHIWLSAVVTLLCLSTLGEGFKDESPRYNYDTLPKTSFSCQGKLAGRYYADAETDCQLFHVCVKMSVRDTQDFKFLCPNGTTFDQEHQVCMDYYNVVCHEGIGTNPLGQFFELMKLSSGLKNPGLDSKLSYVDPDLAERNTLGDDFQVDEYNNNRLASSQNSFYQSTKSNRKPSSDIFYKSQKPTKYTTTTTSTTRRPTTSSTTAAPLVFKSPIPSNEPRTSSVSPRRPSLETFESYETESIAGFAPQNSFNQGANLNPNDFQDSYEVRDPISSTTRRPAVYHNTFRTSFPETPSTPVPSVQTYQQQASRFNDDFFKKLPASTETSVSKAAQFYVNANSNQYSTPQVRQPTSNPFYRATPTTPSTPRRSQSSSTSRPYQTSNTNAGFQYEIQSTTEEPYYEQNPVSTTEYPTNKPYFSAKINDRDRGLSNRGSSSAQRITTSVPSVLVESARHSKFYVPSQSNFEENNASPKSFSSKIVNSFNADDSIRPRSFSGSSNSNSVNRQSNRDNFGFSTILPPTTAEPKTRPTTTTGSYYQTETEVPRSKANTYFQRITTLKPEKFSIFFSKSTTYANKEYSEKETKVPGSGRSTSVYYESTSTYRPPTTNRIPFEYEQQTSATTGSRVQNYENSYTSTTQYPESTTTYSTTTTPKPSRRGARRRINRPRPLVPRNFDPEFKYSRQIDTTGTKENATKESFSKNDEIFTAQASVFPGRTKDNLFHDQRKEVIRVKDVKEEVKQTKVSVEDSPKIVENYGRRIRPNRREQIHQRKPVEVQDAPATTEKAVEHQPRRLIKRLKVKVSTPAPATTRSPSSTSTNTPSTTTTTPPPSTTSYKPSTSTFSQFGSTLRPVKRINVKTKIGQRKFDQEPHIQTSQSRNPFYELFGGKQKKASTTEEPELVTASAEDIARRKQSKLTTAALNKELTTPTTFRPTFAFNEKKNSTSSVIIKVTTKSQQSPFPTPISFKQPILTKFDKKESKYTKESGQDGPTRSPDYDYSYYNTDDDYSDQTSKLEHKNYGKKPNNKKALPQSF